MSYWQFAGTALSRRVEPGFWVRLNVESCTPVRGEDFDSGFPWESASFYDEP